MTSLPEANPHEFAGRVALVTGAAGQGIGHAVARRLLQGGADVVITDVHGGRVKKVSEELKGLNLDGQVLGLVLDVTQFAEADGVAHEVQRQLGPVRILVNNAAYNVMAPIWEYRPEDWARVMDTNINGPWYLSKLFMTQMREAGGGAIVNVSTIAPDVGGLGLEGPYAVSKGGLNTLTRSCAHEGGPFNIRANTVTMGLVRGTRFTDVLHPEMVPAAVEASPLKALPEASDIAEAVAFLASDRARFITGETINISAGEHMRY